MLKLNVKGKLPGGFLESGVPFLGIPIIRVIVVWGLYWGPLILETIIYVRAAIREINVLLVGSICLTV